MLRTGTGLAIPQELLHGAEVARGPQPLAADGARRNAKEAGFVIVYDKTYPPSTTDFTPIVRAIDASLHDVRPLGADAAPVLRRYSFC